jgi:hypothetical protein
MIKHIGKHNDKRVVLLYRQVPNEEHMCLVSYSDLLPRHLHDDIMRVLESPEGQASKELADVLFRNMTSDGRNILEVLHREGFIKKIQTAQVQVTPTSTSSVRLDELNKILNEMSQGQQAQQRLAELDRNAGMGGERAAPLDTAVAMAKELTEPAALSDADLATNFRKQAHGFREQAQRLLAEAEELELQAQQLTPVAQENTRAPKPNATRKTKKKQEV